MVRDTVSYLRAQGRRVFVDCEHFFDGYRANPDVRQGRRHGRARGGRRRGRPVRHERRHAARPGPGDHRHGPRRHRGPPRHPRPGRHRLRRRQHPRRRRRGRDPRAVHGQRLRRARRQLQPLPGRRRPGAEVRQEGPPRGRPARDDPHLARHRRGRQPHPLHASAVRGCFRLRPQGGPARLGDQGRPGPLPAHRPGPGRQPHAHARLRHGGPRLHRAQGQGARRRHLRRPRARRPRRRAGQGARAQGLHVRGGRRLLRTPAARGGRGPRPRATSASSRGGPSSRTAPTAATPTRRP